MTDARFDSAAALLTENARRAALRLGYEEKMRAEEFRLRAGKPFSVVFPEGERTLSADGRLDASGPVRVTIEDIGRTLDAAAMGSAHTTLESVRCGYVTASGGHRIGICGQSVLKGEELYNIRQPSSLNIRIARERKGIADALIPSVLEGGRFLNTLILSPPGCGKTTLLRDFVRRLSDGGNGPAFPGFRISLVDERNEISAQFNGEPQLDIGKRTDVLSGCRKPQAVLMMLRSMSPQIIALDEITAPEDIKSIVNAVYCGVGLVATAHADGEDDLLKRPLYRTLLAENIFRIAVVITKKNGIRQYKTVYMGGCEKCSD